MKNKFLLAMVLPYVAFLVAGCEKYADVENPHATEVRVGNGTIKSFSTIKNGIPEAVGIEISPAALTGLNNSAHGMYMLALDQSIKELTPFDHIVVDWNPQGHLPAKVYDVPHFDIHFYTISMAERLAIGNYNTDSIAFKKDPPSDFLPRNYFPAAPDPAMGKHWVDTTAEEFKRPPFTKTFIYGTYNGRVNFYEPMIAKSFLDKMEPFFTDYPQPTMFSPAKSYFPTRYQGEKNEGGNYCVSLTKFVFR